MVNELGLGRELSNDFLLEAMDFNVNFLRHVFELCYSAFQLNICICTAQTVLDNKIIRFFFAFLSALKIAG